MAKKVFSRPKSLKEVINHYCPGCGHSIAHRLIAEVIDELDIRGITIGVPPAGYAGSTAWAWTSHCHRN